MERSPSSTAAVVSAQSPIQRAHSTNGQLLWILRTRTTDYVFGLDHNGVVQHVYWGASLPLISDYGEPGPFGFANLENTQGIGQDEYPVWGGLRFNEPCLKLQMPDGVRGGQLVYVEDAITEQDGLPCLTITLKDPVYPFAVDLIYRVAPDQDIIERGARFHNTGTQAITLERAASAMLYFPRRQRYTLRTLTGRWAAEDQLQTAEVPIGNKQVIERRSGSGSHTDNPWFNLGVDNADETHGEVWFGSLMYGGNYKTIVERTPHGQTMLNTGISDFDFAWHLAPGESFETPRLVSGYTVNGYGGAGRLLHAYQIGHVLPRRTANTVRRVLYNSWEVTFFDVSFQNQKLAAERAAAMGVELFVMDDGWFGQRKDDHAGLGDWYVNKKKFPDGLTPLIGYVNKLGMDFGLWVEPEMVNPDSDLYRAHPDWIYRFPTRPMTESRWQHILNVGRDDVQAFMFDMLDNLLREYNITFFKWDMNRMMSEPGWPDAPAGREREVWVRHIRGVYEVMRRIREAHPTIQIEACAGGGGRVDMGVMRYVEQFWMSDNTDGFDSLVMGEGFSMAYAPLTRMTWVTDTTSFSRRTTPLRYRFHVAMLGSLGIGANLTHWTDAELKLGAAYIALYKSIRETLQFGMYYRLIPLHTTAYNLTAVQFVHQDGHESVLFVFLQATRFGTTRQQIRLQGLNADTRYAVETVTVAEEGQAGTVTGTTTEGVIISGRALMSRGLLFELTGDYDSRLIRLTAIQD